ncbi:MAG TPA: hypothetical protein VFR73_05415 [Hyphomicrobiaceae bacterium]|nr:hypothetical protein [Hyphomicrobiaceae bacterium]
MHAHTLNTDAPLMMAPVQITNGPMKSELVARTLSNLPVNFQTPCGSVEVFIEEIKETDPGGDHYSFVGLIVAGARTGAPVQGKYDTQAQIGTMTVVPTLN